MKKTTFLILILLSVSAFGQNKLTSSVTEIGDGLTFVNSYKTEYIYDGDNNLKEEIDLSWDFATSQWTNSSKTNFIYNSNNKATIELYQDFDTDTNMFSEEDKTTYTYNANGAVIEILTENWNGTIWVNSYKTDLTYTNNRILSGLSYEWDGSAWGFNEDSSQITLNYNGNGTVSSFVSNTWDGSNWVSDSRTLFSYDSNQNTTLLDSQTWDGVNWISDYKEEKTYDDNGNVIVEKESYLEDGAFVTEGNEINTFDTSLLMSSFAHPFKDKTGLDFIFFGSGIVNKILTSTYDGSRTTYNYGEATASVKDFSFKDFAVYPNPTNAILKIDDRNFSIKNVEIFNVIGEKVMSSTKNELNVLNLVNGVYFLKIQSQNGDLATKRIVKN